MENHRIIEQFGLGTTFKGHLWFPAPEVLALLAGLSLDMLHYVQRLWEMAQHKI